MLFLSTIINKVDKKGRVSVPAAFRAALATQSFQGVVLFRSTRLPALEAFAYDRMQKIAAATDRFDLFSDTHNDLSAAIFADAQALAFDPEGRIMLSDSLLQHAGITEQAAFVGTGASFQIWEPGRFNAHQQEARGRLKQNPPALKLGSET